MQGQMIFPDSIYALSSGRLPSGVAVVRLSGRHTREALIAMTGSVPEPRLMRFGSIRSADGRRIDRALTVFFPSPASFTGEDSCEFHLHGGRAVVEAMLEAIGSLPGFRQAEPGEFTRRSFLNGKMDLTSAEALSDLISAETEAQRRFALANADGKQSELYLGWRRRIVYARAMVEAELDFSDQEDVPGSVSGVVWSDMEAMVGEIESHIASYRRAEIVRDGFKVVILGAPNVGKSSLLNVLARRDVAIVTDEAGTTRDLVEVALDLDGIKVVLVDTAGIRVAAGKVEAIGIRRALESAASADLVLEMHDLSNDADLNVPVGATERLTVGSKSDLDPMSADKTYDFRISTKTEDGVAQLLAAIAEQARQAVGNIGDVMPSRVRHLELLRACAASLRDSLENSNAVLELRAEDLRRASDHLGRIAGAVDVEDLLDGIFSTFCVGK